jgi:hypothetical protein
LISLPVFGQEPSLILHDSEGNSYTSDDNSTYYSALPGEMFSLEITGPDYAEFGLYLSLYKTPYPQTMQPPPLFLMPPYILMDAGNLSTTGYQGLFVIPTSVASIGYDIDFYMQAFTYEAVHGHQLTNGITLGIPATRYKARVAYTWGTHLTKMFEVGERVDLNAGDNELGQGAGLKHGGEFIPDTDMGGDGFFEFSDVNAPSADEFPKPSTSLYLNGIFPLVPGDSGFSTQFNYYPQVGSSPYIYARDRICRNAENLNLQHIIIPVFDDQGEKIHDMNLYQFKFRKKNDTYEYGFMVLDVLTNDFYELKGTRKDAQIVMEDEEERITSPWEPYVAISPDGRYMAAVFKKDHSDPTYYLKKDELYVIKLLRDDVWQNGNVKGLHARPIKINNPPLTNPRSVTRIYAESMIFAGDPDPHALFVATNLAVRNTQGAIDPSQFPFPNHPANIWRVDAGFDADGDLKAKDFNFLGDKWPKAGGGLYSFAHFGSSTDWDDKVFTELKWIRSEDNKTIIVRGAGRKPEDGTSWSYDLLAITDISCDDNDGKNLVEQDVVNFTGFDETQEGKGFYIEPFGHCYNRYSKACLGMNNPAGVTYFAFAAKSYTAAGDSEDLYVAPIDGSVAGSLVPVTNPNFFKGIFQTDSTRGMGIFDPFFMTPDTVVFYAGKNDKRDKFNHIPCHTDLFLYRASTGEYRNLTVSGRLDDAQQGYPHVYEPTPPFTVFGEVLPSGMILSDDGKYMFFFRAWSGIIFDTANTRKKVNLIGVDIENDFALIDLSGDEFSQGYMPALDYEDNSSKDYWWGAEAFNVLIVPGVAGGAQKMFFSNKYYAKQETKAHQVFMANMTNPTVAYPVTNFDIGEKSIIDNLAVDPTGSYVAFSRSNDIFLDWTEGAFEDIYIVDLTQGMLSRNLTYMYPPNTRASIDGSLLFLPSGSPEVPLQLIYGIAEGGIANQANNPKDARLWLFPLLPYEVPDLDPLPLTEQAQYLVMNVLPVTEE